MWNVGDFIHDGSDPAIELQFGMYSLDVMLDIMHGSMTPLITITEIKQPHTQTHTHIMHIIFPTIQSFHLQCCPIIVQRRVFYLPEADWI